MGSEDVSRSNVLVGVAMAAGLSGDCMYRSESSIVVMEYGRRVKAIGREVFAR